VAGLGLERDAGRARLERKAMRLAVAGPLREEQHRPASGQDGPAAPERIEVPGHVLPVLTPIDGHSAGQDQQRRDHRVAPQRALGEDARAQSEEGDDQQGVDERVHVVGDDQEGHAPRHAREPHDLDLAEEHAQGQPRQQRQHPVEAGPPGFSHTGWIVGASTGRRSPLVTLSARTPLVAAATRECYCFN
jgi:hypothetical protein